jgi:hypothetical protein
MNADPPRAGPENDEAAFVALLEPTGELAASTASATIARLSLRVSDGTRTRDRLDHNQGLSLISRAGEMAPAVSAIPVIIASRLGVYQASTPEHNPG